MVDAKMPKVSKGRNPFQIPFYTWGNSLALAEVPTTQPLVAHFGGPKKSRRCYLNIPQRSDHHPTFEVILCQERLERLVRTDEVGDAPTKNKTGGLELVICTR